MRCEVLWHGKMDMESDDALAWNGRWSDVEHNQVLGEELATSQKMKKNWRQAHKTQKTNFKRTYLWQITQTCQ